MSARNPSWFTWVAKVDSRAAGGPSTFIAAVLITLLGAISGSLFDFSETWQLVINIVTTIVTFLMVFLIQNTQNRDTEALQIKLDELLRAVRAANNNMIGREELDDKELMRSGQTPWNWPKRRGKKRLVQIQKGEQKNRR